MTEEKRQPYAGESYIEVNEEGYYVDKTLFIRDLCEGGSEVYLLARPMGFGKSMNLDMLKVFFEKTEEDTFVYFTDKKIWQEDEYRSEQGKYPVVFMSFAGARQGTWDRKYKRIKGIIADEFKRHTELKTSDKVNGHDLDEYSLICEEKGTPAQFGHSLLLLTRMLRACYGVPAIVLIDDYDVPIQKACGRKDHDEAVGFMRSFLGNGLKTNFDMRLGVLTGVLPYTEVSVYTGLNNMGVYTVLNDDFSEYFGFTREEAQGILEYYGYGEKMCELAEWYGGYDFGGREIFNPRSVMSYVDSGCSPKVYRADTYLDSVAGELLRGAAGETAEKLTRLLKGETISCMISRNIVFPELKRDAGAVFALLLFSGYLKSVGEDEENPGGCGDRYLLKIPNREMGTVFAGDTVRR